MGRAARGAGRAVRAGAQRRGGDRGPPGPAPRDILPGGASDRRRGAGRFSAAPGRRRAARRDFAAAYRARPSRLIVRYPRGGTVELVTRVVTEGMAGRLGQPCAIESRAGANGTIAPAAVAHADPDGYTLLMITDSHGVNPLFYKT